MNMLRRRDWLALFAALAAAALLNGMQGRAHEAGRTDALSGAVQAIVAPASKALRSVSTAMGSSWTAWRDAQDLIARNRVLEQQVRVAALYNENVSRLTREIEALRSAMSLPAPAGKTKLYAEIVGYFPQESMITVSSGASDGVWRGAAVVTGDGLVGVVSAVGPSTSEVTLMGSPSLVIGGMLDRNPPLAGLIRGYSPGDVRLQLANPRAPVQVGDRVFTSGFGIVPRGILVGRVVQVIFDEAFGRKEALILPSVEVGGLRQVVIFR